MRFIYTLFFSDIHCTDLRAQYRILDTRTFFAMCVYFFIYIYIIVVHLFSFLFCFFLPSDGFFVSGLNLTADRSYITMNPKESLRTLTFNNWECLRTWVEVQKPGSEPKSLNIIAGDFVGPLPLCSLVIELNQKLLQKTSRHFKKR